MGDRSESTTITQATASQHPPTDARSFRLLLLLLRITAVLTATGEAQRRNGQQCVTDLGGGEWEKHSGVLARAFDPQRG